MKRSTYSVAALAALALLPTLAAKSARAQQTLSPALFADDITLTELAARHPLSAEERAQVIAIDQAQFRREPAWLLKTLRGQVTDVKNVRRMDPVRLAEWRKAHLTGTLFHPDPHLTPAEHKVMLAIYTRTNPIVAVGADIKTVITEADVDAWAVAMRLVCQKSGMPVTVDPRPTLIQFAKDSRHSLKTRVMIDQIERDWAAYRLGWKHEPVRDQRHIMASYLRQIRQAPQGSRFATAAGVALDLGDDAFGDYPYSMSPAFATMKGRLMVESQKQALSWMRLHQQISHNQDMLNMTEHTIRENGRIMQNGNNTLAGHPENNNNIPDPMPLPAP